MNNALLANVVHFTAELDKLNAHVAKLHRNAQLIKDEVSRSGRKSAMEEYKSIIAKYQTHVAAREKMASIQRRLDQCRAGVRVLEDVVKEKLDDASCLI